MGSSGQHGLCMWETSREDLGMSLASFTLPGGLGMCEHQGRILGYPWDPPDCLEYHACGDIQGGFWDLLGLLQTSWRAMCVGLLRILGCPWDPLDCLEGCKCGGTQGRSWDVLEILWTAWRAVCVGTTREDPGNSLGSSGLPGNP